MKVRAGLELPALPIDAKLRAVLNSALAKAGARPAAPSAEPYWGPEQFGLERARVWREASAEERRAILELGGRMLLEEAYFIEKSGMAFTAKMCLLATSIEERQLYSLFAADEAAHLAEVMGYLGDAPTDTNSPFLRLLSALIEDGDRDSLVFTIQIVLEGWGLSHYRRMATSCRSKPLEEALHRIVRDEARHHGSGVVLFDEERLSPASRAYIEETLLRFLGMVRVGPQGLATAVAKVKGGLTAHQKLELFIDLGGEAHAQQRLDSLEGLMLKAGASGIARALRAKGAFTPLAVSACARECAA